MPAANRGKKKPASVASDSFASDSSGTTSPDAGMEVPSIPNSQTGGPTEKRKYCKRSNNTGKTVALTIRPPRLTANGKRVGRPPGTFKTQPSVTIEPGSEEPNPTYCEWNQCNTKFDSVAVSGPESEKNKMTKSYYMLIGHVRGHIGDKPNKCDHPNCPKAYKSKENLVTHKRSHTGEKPFGCHFENCQKRFTNASDRGKHENRCHSNRKDYICDVENCTKSYTDPSSLRKHIICVHGPEVQEIRKKKKAELLKAVQEANSAFQMVMPPEELIPIVEPIVEPIIEPIVEPIIETPIIIDTPIIIPEQQKQTPDVPHLGSDTSAFRSVTSSLPPPVQNSPFLNPLNHSPFNPQDVLALLKVIEDQTAATKPRTFAPFIPPLTSPFMLPQIPQFVNPMSINTSSLMMTPQAINFPVNPLFNLTTLPSAFPNFF